MKYIDVQNQTSSSNVDAGAVVKLELELPSALTAGDLERLGLTGAGDLERLDLTGAGDLERLDLTGAGDLERLDLTGALLTGVALPSSPYLDAGEATYMNGSKRKLHHWYCLPANAVR